MGRFSPPDPFALLRLARCPAPAIERWLELELDAEDHRALQAACAYSGLALGDYYYWYRQKAHVASLVRRLSREAMARAARRMDLTDYAALAARLPRDRGIVLALPHHGHYIVSAINIMQHLGRDRQVLMLYGDPSSHRGNEAFDDLTRVLFPPGKTRSSVVHTNRAGMAAILKALSRGAIVVTMPDVYMRRDETYALPFCGRTLNVMLGTASMARKTGACILPAVSEIHGRKLVTRCGELIFPGDTTDGLSRDFHDYANTAAMFRFFEAVMGPQCLYWQYVRQHFSKRVPFPELRPEQPLGLWESFLKDPRNLASPTPPHPPGLPMKKTCASLLAALCLAPQLLSTTHAGDGAQPVTELPTVKADASGPPIWRFVRGDRTVLVLGTLQPLPRDVAFVDTGLQSALAASGAILGSEGVDIGADIGLFRGLTLWPSIRKTKLIEGGKRLADVVPAEDYRRWSELKARYLPGNDGVERLRPMYAAWQLYEAALSARGMAPGSPVSRQISSSARKLDLEIVDARYQVKVRNPKEAVTSFEVDREADLTCFRRTLHDLEPWLDAAPAIADAWSRGDTATTSAILETTPRLGRCWARLTNEAIAQAEGVDAARAAREQWLAALERAAREHPVLFTTLPLDELLDGQGSAQALQAAGFRLEAPAGGIADVSASELPEPPAPAGSHR